MPYSCWLLSFLLLIKWLTSVSPLLEASYLRNRVWLGPCLLKIEWKAMLFPSRLHLWSSSHVQRMCWKQKLESRLQRLVLSVSFLQFYFFPLRWFILYYDPWTASRNMMSMLAKAVRNNFDMNRDHWNVRCQADAHLLSLNTAIEATVGATRLCEGPGAWSVGAHENSPGIIVHGGWRIGCVRDVLVLCMHGVVAEHPSRVSHPFLEEAGMCQKPFSRGERWKPCLSLTLLGISLPNPCVFKFE